ncbi:M50 family metallopeptidase [Rummeliibacillus stabekisii]|uniref:M50 family metallopeptidase n=1 Tax=Rummeliibacillus stabekisii TaxID=241244 RepID=UPI00203B205A|nr:M50 family metallopeptidase [Rummeliibacillus stabekisii]MCM3318044.1 M50 family metallopeptidase [Rummeliibacillus stabekisii]
MVIIIVYLLCSIYFSFLSSVYLHELGHYLVGKMFGLKMIEASFCVGKVKYKKNNYIFGLNPFKGYSYIFSDLTRFKQVSKFKRVCGGCLLALGGPLMNLVACITFLFLIGLIMFLKLDLYPLTVLLIASVITNFYGLISNLIPRGNGAGISDGKNFIKRLFGRPEVEFYISKLPVTIHGNCFAVKEYSIMNKEITGTFYATDKTCKDGFFQFANNGFWCVVKNNHLNSIKYSTFKELIIKEGN